MSVDLPFRLGGCEIPDYQSSILTSSPWSAPFIQRTLLHLHHPSKLANKDPLSTDKLAAQDPSTASRKGDGWQMGPEHIPYEDFSQIPRLLRVDVLDRAAELDVHICVHGNQLSTVLGLAPLEPDDNVLVDPTQMRKSH